MKIKQLLMVLCLVISASGIGVAQAIKGTLLGNVTDSSGAAAANATCDDYRNAHRR